MPKVKTARERTPFGRRMLEARKAAGLTQEQVCKVIGVSQGTLSELELQGSGSVHVVAYADLYGVSPRWLDRGEGTPGGPLSEEPNGTTGQPADLALRLANAFAALPAVLPNKSTKRALYIELMALIRRRQMAAHVIEEPDSLLEPTPEPPADPKRRRAPARGG